MRLYERISKQMADQWQRIDRQQRAAEPHETIVEIDSDEGRTALALDGPAAGRALRVARYGLSVPVMVGWQRAPDGFFDYETVVYHFWRYRQVHRVAGRLELTRSLTFAMLAESEPPHNAAHDSAMTLLSVKPWRVPRVRISDDFDTWWAVQMFARDRYDADPLSQQLAYATGVG